LKIGINFFFGVSK